MTKIHVGQGPVTERTLRTGRHFPNFVDAYLDYTKDHEASRKFHKWTAISILGSALERKVWIDRGYYKIFPNLYILVVGPAGIVKKSTSTGIGVDLLREVQTIRVMADQMSSAALIEGMASAGHKFTFKDQEIMQSPIFLYASEFKVLMDEVHGSLKELLTTFFDCSPQDSRKPWVRETKGAGQIKIYGPCINMLGCSTSTWLKECVPVSQLEGGFASRILYIVDNALPDKFVAIPRPDPGRGALRDKLIDDLAYIHNLRGEFRMSEESEVHFTAWYAEHMLTTAARKFSDKFSGYLGRKSTMVEKLAMVLAVAESDSLIIEIDHLKAAIAALDAIAKDMYNAFAGSGKNENASIYQMVFDLIRSSGGASQMDLFKALWSEADPKVLGDILGGLQQMGAIVQHSTSNGIYYKAQDGVDSLWGMVPDFTGVSRGA